MLRSIGTSKASREFNPSVCYKLFVVERHPALSSDLTGSQWVSKRSPVSEEDLHGCVASAGNVDDASAQGVIHHLSINVIGDDTRPFPENCFYLPKGR